MNTKYDKNSETYRDKDFFDKMWKDEQKIKREIENKNRKNEINKPCDKNNKKY